LDNGNIPNEPILNESTKADTQQFLDEMLSILPLVDLHIFEKSVTEKLQKQQSSPIDKNLKDVIIISAQEDGFKEAFLGEDCWYAIRIAGGRRADIKYIAAYQTSPVSKITHIAEIKSIEEYGNDGKYKVNFASKAKELESPIMRGNGCKHSMQSIRYTSYNRLMNAKDINELLK